MDDQKSALIGLVEPEADDIVRAFEVLVAGRYQEELIFDGC